MAFPSPAALTVAPARPSRLTLLVIFLWIAEGLSVMSTLWATVIALVQVVAPGAFSFGSREPWMQDYQREVTAAALPVVTLPLGVIHLGISAALIGFAVACFRGRALGRERLRSALLVATGFVSLQFLWTLFTSYRAWAVVASYMDVIAAQMGRGSTPPPPGVAESFRMAMMMSLGAGVVFATVVFMIKLALYLYTRRYLGSPEVDRYVDLAA